MKRAEMRKLATGCRDLLIAGDVDDALAQLRPVIASRTPFPLLDLTGRVIAEAAAINPAGFTALLDGLAGTDAIGAWPLIGSALAAAYLLNDTPRAFAEARRYVLQAGVWHATDAIGERVLGEGLRADFNTALSLLEDWREEANPWLRRAVGVAVHLYAKRERDRPEQAARLLDLLEPLFDERDTYALKGVGWGLKTIGKFYPDLLVPWLQKQVATKKPRKLMVRKAVTYLPDDVKTEFL
ncbi:MAG: DNA alkylation repair protein [Anaerolineae bacterium]|nr:DNA alkylation repair protein [Anaerolineae bacterium]